MMSYAIRNTSGQWWTGDCWGVEQAREEYDSLADLPDIEGMIMEEYDTDPESPDIRYYYAEDDMEASASVHVVSGRAMAR